jgi:hypothetical protein
LVINKGQRGVGPSKVKFFYLIFPLYICNMNGLQWSPDEVFEITGYDIETMINVLTSRLLAPEAQKVVREYQTLINLQSKIQNGVNEGKVKIVESDPKDEITP